MSFRWIGYPSREPERLCLRPAHWFVLFGLWALPALITTAAVMAGRYTDDRTWGSMLVEQLGFFWFFAACCPGLYRIGHRSSRAGWLAIHLLGGALAIAAVPAVSVLVDRLLLAGTGGVASRLVAEWTSPQAPIRAFITLLYYSVAVGVVELVRSRRQRASERERRLILEQSLTRARLEGLQAQIRPHFLFNTLNSISALVKSGDRDGALATIARLGAMLRASLAGPDRHSVKLTEELDLVDGYLDIEQLRYAERLQVTRRIDHDCLDAQVPPLLLQPIVENGVRHGVARTEGTCRIKLRAWRDKGDLHLEVQDDGPGLSADGHDTQNGGVGLRNVQERLEAMYAGRSSLEVAAAPGGGTRVRIRLPYDGQATRGAKR